MLGILNVLIVVIAAAAFAARLVVFVVVVVDVVVAAVGVVLASCTIRASSALRWLSYYLQLTPDSSTVSRQIPQKFGHVFLTTCSSAFP